REDPACRLWRSPLYPIGYLLFQVHGLEALIVVLCALALYREARRNPIDRAGTVRGASCVRSSALVYLVTVLVLGGWGIARGGNVSIAVQALRLFLAVPLLTFLFSVALKGPADHAALGLVLVAAACTKALMGLYVYQFVAKAAGLELPYVTTHSDS